MTEAELTAFAWNIVDENIEHVFLRFPEDGDTRAKIYRHLAQEFLELAETMDMG